MATLGVVIRTLNEAALIGTCLEALRRQRSGFELDILVVDSGSTDATLEIVRSHGVRTHELPPGDFDYSSSLNVGIEAVAGELVVILSAHAVPVGDEDGRLGVDDSRQGDERQQDQCAGRTPEPRGIPHHGGDAQRRGRAKSEDGGPDVQPGPAEDLESQLDA